MSRRIHDTLVYRLTSILIKLNQGEQLNPQSLADEYGVTLRTIQRDINVRFAYLPLQKTKGLYHLDPLYLGQFSRKDIDRFAGLAGVRSLFPSLSDDFLREIFNSATEPSILVRGHNYEKLEGKEELFQRLEQAVSQHIKVSFNYTKGQSKKPYNGVMPYKLINNKGIWYLSGVDEDKLKTFTLNKIKNLTLLDSHFTPDEKVSALINEDEGVWVSAEKFEVVLKVESSVASYFKRRKLIANQVIEKELEDGSLLISARVGHKNQIIPIVRYWIPHIKIITPEHLQQSLEQELRAYTNL